MMKKLSPVLVVDQIEPVLPLGDALGFSRTAEVPQRTTRWCLTLRMTMMDPTKQNPDEEFMAMMHDFVTTYSGKNPYASHRQHARPK